LPVSLDGRVEVLDGDPDVVDVDERDGHGARSLSQGIPADARAGARG
jgi:hypothetical protein